MRVAQAARAAVVGVGHLHHHAAASAAREPAVAFRAGKRQVPRAEIQRSPLVTPLVASTSSTRQ